MSSESVERFITIGGESLSIFDIMQRFRNDGSCEHVILEALKRYSDDKSKPQLLKAFEVCVWKYDPDGYWQTSCGDQFCFSEGGPTENNVKFCHFCGKSMFESVYANEQEETDDAGD